MPDQPPDDHIQKFVQVDQILQNLEFTDGRKATIFQFVAAILHLGNIRFENTSEAQITKETEQHIDLAAKLLQVPADELRIAMTYRIIQVEDSKIK